MDVEIALFDGFDELDAVGPFEVLSNGRRAGADLAVRLVSHEGRDRVTASHGLDVGVDGPLGEPDLLIVPGGGWSDGEGGVARVVEDSRLGAAVADLHAGGTTVASVCTGAMVLAEAGLLDDRPATTHHVAHDDLAAVADRRDARVVDDGDVLTAGGVTSGIDLALYLLEREFGADVAAQVARELEHDRSADVVVTA
jgi:transcriptional regulator GlxA family with amidase domain